MLFYSHQCLESTLQPFCAIALIILLSACATPPADKISSIACSEPRPQVCTMVFLPTCAVLVAGGHKEFVSPCSACADRKVTGYVNGPCTD